MRKWRESNREKVREYARVFSVKNKEKLKIGKKIWREANRETLNEKNRIYYTENKDKVRAKNIQYAKGHREENNRRAREWRKNSEAFALWKKSNRDEIARKQREWRRTSPAWTASKDRNREKCRISSIEFRKTETYRSWWNTTREKRAKYMLDRYYAHRDHYKEFQRLYGGNLPNRVAIYVKWEVCGKICYICDADLVMEDIQIDHVHPSSKGGTNDIWNLMPVHAKCNNKKKDKTDFPISRPDLVELAKSVKAMPRKQVGIKIAVKQ